MLFAHEATPRAKMPLTLLPDADPPYDAAEAAATPEEVEAQQAYVYLFLVVTVPPGQAFPMAKIPRVLFPVADP